MKLWQAKILVALKLATINDGRVRFLWERGNQKHVERMIQFAMWSKPLSTEFSPDVYYYVKYLVTGSNLSWNRYIDGKMKKWRTS